ncbi:MAG: UPF0158 family protein [Polyangiaceae bacterium]|nr:UPF0158 family protein [Polyangiaceae bacterium]
MATSDETPPDGPKVALREVPVDWEALEDAFENNAPEVHSYLHLSTGDVLRVVDGVADPQMHARINADNNYLRIAPVSSREQYRWMERYIPMVEEPDLRAKLAASIDGKGAFRRFKDVLMNHSAERERWFAFRSERLRTFMEAWLAAHAIQCVPRPVWANQQPGGPPPPSGPGVSISSSSSSAAQPPLPTVERTSAGDDQPPISQAALDGREARRGRNAETLRKNLRDVAESLGPRDLESLVSFAEFLKARRIARSYQHHLETTHAHDSVSIDEPMPASFERNGRPGAPVSSAGVGESSSAARVEIRPTGSEGTS